MGRSLGVANSTADIDSGVATGLSTFSTASGSSAGFYGATPITQRAAAIQANSVVSVSSNITIAASLTAWIVEVTATLNALGLWKGAA
jgi:hypothetical protein